MKHIREIQFLLLFCFYPGCYSATIITDQSDSHKIFQKKEPVYIKTITGTEIYFQTGAYKLDTDTLCGEGQKVIGLEMMQEAERVRIPMNDIKQVKVRNLDMGKTMVSGIILAGVFYWHYMWSQTETQ